MPAVTISVGAADFTSSPPIDQRGGSWECASLADLAAWLNLWTHPTADKRDAGPYWRPGPPRERGVDEPWPLLALDYDGNAPPAELGLWDRVTYETRSSTDTVRRWRVVVGVTRPVTSAEVRRLIRYYGSDTGAGGANRLFWGQHPRGGTAAYTPGVSGALDVDALLASLPLEPEPAPLDGWTEEAVPHHGIADDGELVAHALRSRSAASTFGGGASFADLWECNVDKLAAAYPPSQPGQAYDASRADQALANHLAFWTGGNCEQIARLMRTSGLTRPKHDRDDYLRATVLRACAGRTAWYSTRSAPAPAPPPAVVPPAPAAAGESGAVYVPIVGRDGRYDATLPNLEYVLVEQRSGRLAFDTFRDRVMVAPDGTEDWRPLTDHDITTLRNDLEKIHRFKPIPKALMLDALSLVAMRYQFDSAQRWLAALAWDGVPRVDRFLTDYCGAADEAYSHAVSRYIWTGLANRVLVPGCQLDMVVALVSPQGRRKSTGLAALTPDPEFFSDSVSLLAAGDDYKRHIRGKLVVELAELAGLSRAELEHVKAMITRRREEWTEKYQTQPTRFDRRCMLFATTNDERFLPPDETGNRRWLPVRVVALDRDAIAADRAQLWAEGAAIYAAAGQAWQEAETLAAARHAEHEAHDVWTESIQRWLDAPVVVAGAPAGPPPGLGAFTVADVLRGALNIAANQMDSRNEKRVARTLRQLGYEPKLVKANGIVKRCWLNINSIHAHNG